MSQAVRGLVAVHWAKLVDRGEQSSLQQSAAVLFTCECSFWDPPEEGGRALNFVVLEIHRLTLFYGARPELVIEIISKIYFWITLKRLSLFFRVS